MASYDVLLHTVVRREQRLRAIRRYQAQLDEYLHEMRVHAELARLVYPWRAAHWELVLRIVEALELQNGRIGRSSLRRLERGLVMVLRITA